MDEKLFKLVFKYIFISENNLLPYLMNIIGIIVYDKKTLMIINVQIKF